MEDGHQTVETTLPAVLLASSGLNEPRYPSLKGIMAAKKKPLEEKAAELPASRVTVRELTYPPERPAGRIVGQGIAAVPDLVRLLREEAKVI
jgi:electron transfer flavoprotein beta subunit